jgi:hypothetical protein
VTDGPPPSSKLAKLEQLASEGFITPRPQALPLCGLASDKHQPRCSGTTGGAAFIGWQLVSSNHPTLSPCYAPLLVGLRGLIHACNQSCRSHSEWSFSIRAACPDAEQHESGAAAAGQPTAEEEKSVNAITWIGVIGLALVVLSGVGASLFAKRNDEMQSGKH